MLQWDAVSILKLVSLITKSLKFNKGAARSEILVKLSSIIIPVNVTNSTFSESIFFVSPDGMKKTLPTYQMQKFPQKLYPMIGLHSQGNIFKSTSVLKEYHSYIIHS